MNKLVTCRVLDADGYWEYSDVFNLIHDTLDLADVEDFMRRKVEMDAMYAYWNSLDKEIIVRELDEHGN